MDDQRRLPLWLGDGPLARLAAVAAAAMAVFLLLRLGVLPAASAGDDVWYDEAAYWLLHDGVLRRAIHDNALGDAARDFLPPVAAVATALAFRLFGYTQLAVGIAPSAAAAVAIAATGLALHRRFGMGRLAGMGLAVLPFYAPALLKVVGHNRFEAYVLAFLGLALRCGAAAGERRPALLVAAGLCTGVAVLAYYPAAPLIAGIAGLWVLGLKPGWPRLGWFVAGGLLAAAGLAAWIGRDAAWFAAAMSEYGSRYHHPPLLAQPSNLLVFVPCLAGIAACWPSRAARPWAALAAVALVAASRSHPLAIYAAYALMLGLVSAGYEDRGRAARAVAAGLLTMVVIVCAGGLWTALHERDERDFAAMRRNLLAVAPAGRGGLVLFDRPAHLALRPCYGAARLHQLMGPGSINDPSRLLFDPRRTGQVEAVVLWPGGGVPVDAYRQLPLVAGFLAAPHRAVDVSPFGIGPAAPHRGVYHLRLLLPADDRGPRLASRCR